MSMKSAAGVMAALLVASSALAAEPILLQYKFSKEEPLRYRLEMKSTSAFTTPDGKKEEQTMESTMDLTQELIEAKADGSYRVAVTVEKAIQKINGQEKPMPNQPGAQIMTMLPTGKVMDAQGPDPGAASQMQMIFPSKPIAVGESWEQVGRLAQPLPLETTTKYTLAKADGTAVINSDMSINSEKGPGGEKVQSSTKGELLFDTQKGRMLKSTAKSNFKFDLPIQVPGMPTAQNVNVNLDLDLKIELVGK